MNDNYRTPEDDDQEAAAYQADQERRWQEEDAWQRETACRQALDRINLGLHTSADVALLRRELNL